MNKFEADDFRNVYERLYDCGVEVKPRGQKVREVENFHYILAPGSRFTNYESRKLNLNYIKTEFLWYLKGDPSDLSILEHAKLWRGLVRKDGTIASNYGQYIFRNGVFDYVVKELARDRDSRRASMVILGTHHLLSEEKDLPCTYSLNFRVRDGKLNMTVHMRSQDAVFGMGNDAPAFSFIHEMVWQALTEFYPELQWGNYHHFADSFHVYERHFDLLEKIVKGDPYTMVDCPRISGPEEVKFLRDVVKYPLFPAEDVPKEFAFTHWLNDSTK